MAPIKTGSAKPTVNKEEKLNNTDINKYDSNQIVQVNGAAEVIVIPDRCKLAVQLTSTKQDLADVRDSVNKRADYLKQSLQNHGVKTDLIEESRVVKSFGSAGTDNNMEGCSFKCDYEIISEFSNFNKCQDFCNTMSEKLGSSITIMSPEFYSTGDRLANIRRKTFYQALRDAKTKAVELSTLLKLSIGEPIKIVELDPNDRKNEVIVKSSPNTQNKKHTGHSSQATPLSQSVSRLAAEHNSIIISSNVRVTFPIKRNIKLADE